MKRFILVASVVLAAPLTASAQETSTAGKHVSTAPILGLHFGGAQYASMTFGYRAVRRKWAPVPGVEPGPIGVAAIEPGLAAVRANLQLGWVWLEEGTDKDTRFAIQVIGAQVGPSLLQTWGKTYETERLSTYAGVDARVNFIAGVSAALYWRVAGREQRKGPIPMFSFGFSY